MQSFPVILCVLAIISPILCETQSEPQSFAVKWSHPNPEQSPELTNSLDWYDDNKLFAKRGLSDWLGRIPSINDIITGTKEMIAGTPARIITRIINKICGIAVSSGALVRTYVPRKSEIMMYVANKGVHDPIPLKDASKLLEYPEFQSARNLTIFITGWKSNYGDENDVMNALYKAYSCRDAYNLVIIDTGRFIDSLHKWATFDTETIGEWVGKAIADLAEEIPAAHLHLIGHSLGAHIAGAAARHFYELTGQQIPRVTGLDPALPCFDQSRGVFGLQRGDAGFVDIIHSNNGVLGNRDPVGDVDFYPNGLNSLQLGCSHVMCSHFRAISYYAESVVPGLEESFMAVRCNTAIQANKCHGMTAPMGFATPTNMKGNYILETNSVAPYGKNATAYYDVKCKTWSFV